MTRLRVALDATPLFNPNPRGIGRYILELVPALCAQGVEVTLTVKISRLQSPSRLVRLRALRRVAPSTIALLARARGIPLFHGTNRFVSGLFPRSVLTVHDMLGTRRDLPYLGEPFASRIRMKMERAMSRRPGAVIVDSAFGASEFLRFYDYPADRLFVAHLGAPSWPEANPAEPRPFEGEDGAYVVFLGEPEPRKRVEDAIRALAEVGEDISLVVVGGRLFEEQRRLAADVGVADRVRALGVLDDEEVRRRLAGAHCLVFPSAHEGFGLPMLEAFACGVPVVASDCDALVEVGRDAYWRAPVGDYHAIARGVEALRDEAVRARFVAAGRERARAFSWRKTAEITVAAYRRALEP